jgi:hypothetical protein
MSPCKIRLGGKMNRRIFTLERRYQAEEDYYKNTVELDEIQS